jgi:nucleotide-binding universal stress UspA family protein
VSTVLAGIDASPTSPAVLGVAREVARVLAAEVDPIYVVEEGLEASDVDVLGGETPLRVLQGDPAEVLIAEASTESVAAVVLGASRLAGGPATAGHVSLDVIESVGKPVVIVPTGTTHDYALRTVLVPVLRKPTSVLEDVVRLAENPQLRVVILRLLDEMSIPAFEDQPYYDVEAWAEEFLARWVPGAAADTTVEVRIGPPEELVISVAQEVNADLVAIGRRRDVPAAEAPIVVAALQRSPVPVVFLPLVRPSVRLVERPDVEPAT